jgi:hypothetical protein
MSEFLAARATLAEELFALDAVPEELAIARRKGSGSLP